jgi:uncharacterized membrane protein YesL
LHFARTPIPNNWTECHNRHSPFLKLFEKAVEKVNTSFWTFRVSGLDIKTALFIQCRYELSASTDLFFSRSFQAFMLSRSHALMLFILSSFTSFQRDTNNKIKMSLVLKLVAAASMLLAVAVSALDRDIRTFEVLHRHPAHISVKGIL